MIIQDLGELPKPKPKPKLKFYSGKNRLQSLVPESVGIYTADIKRAPHSTLTNYNFLANLAGRLVKEQKTVFRPRKIKREEAAAMEDY